MRFKINRFDLSALTLISSSSTAQAITIALSPIITRLFTPEDFGVYSAYVALVAILLVLVNGKYDQAIILPKSDRTARDIIFAGMVINIIIACLLFGIIFLFDDYLIGFLNNEDSIRPWLYVIPLIVFLTGVYQNFYYWQVRKSGFYQIGASKIFNTSAMNGASIALGFLGFKISGLLLGYLAARFVSLIPLFFKLHDLTWKLNQKRMRVATKKYINFPKFLIFSGVLSALSMQMPVLLLTALFTSTLTGLFVLTQKVARMPITIVASAISDVFKSEASKAFREQGECRAVYKKTLFRLVLIATLPFIVFFFIAPDLFRLVFGQEWREAGVIAQYLVPMMYFQFISSPLSAMYVIAEKQKLDTIFQILLTTITALPFIVASILGWDGLVAVKIFSFLYSLVYLSNLFVTWRFAKNKVKV
ncbi:MAG: hypothetical protein CMP22_07400 [Rickettsiales bacterium]|nr:hypothetical protein [Rickettsiales bacterium]